MPTAATPQEESQRRTRRAHRIQVAAALLFVFAVFSPTLTFDFVNRDDGDHLLNNRLVTGAVEKQWWDYFSTPMIGYPIPVPVLTYRIEHALFGFNPAIYHFTNLVIHCLVALCVYLVARRLGVG